MLKPTAAFTVGGMIAMLSWLGLAAGLFLGAQPQSLIWAATATLSGLSATIVAGGGTGGYMTSQSTHAVGAEGRRLPLFGWSLRNGVMRIPHSLGIHAMQALSLIAAATNRTWVRRSGRLPLAGAVGYGLLYRALRDEPPVPMGEAA